MDAIRAERTERLQSPPQALWPLLSNTDRINRALGLPPTEDAGPAEGFVRLIRMRVLGVPLVWRENPFDFVADRRYSVVRDFVGGPLERVAVEMTLEPDGTGTKAVFSAELTPRGPLTAAVLRVAAPKSVADLAALARRVDESLVRPGPLPPMARACTASDTGALAARARTLAASRAEPAAAARLVDYLRDAYDDELVRLRPFELADRWGLPRRAVLCACLHAVKAGLLDLRWEVLCPNCSSAPESPGSLADLKRTSHCPACGIEYGVDLAESVELRFSVHPSVRLASEAVFCTGSPARNPLAVAQAPLRPGEPRRVDVSLDARAYRVRALGAQRSVLLLPRADAPAELAVDFSTAADGAELAFRPGLVRLTLTAPVADLARVESEAWRANGATAALVASFQDFRDLFSSEVLAPGLEIGVKRLALLFTDLKGSTAMYERLGDASAYGVVRDHFGWLTAIVAARRGAVVKTIGDAVMAVFSSGADALEAALDMQEGIAGLDAKLAPRPPVVLKIGVHEGAAIAINADGILDYFGTTANVAARVQNESEGGDVVITDVLRDDPAVAEVLARRAPPAETFHSELKGLTGVHRLWRLRPQKK